MTFIQPSKNKNIVNLILGGLVLVLFVGTFWVIIVYNQTVSLSHDITKAKSQLDSTGAVNTSFNNNVIATLGGSALSAIAAKDHLVEEKKPEYFRINANDLSLLNNR